jgi:cytochrome c oxidase accessory protein FixG
MVVLDRLVKEAQLPLRRSSKDAPYGEASAPSPAVLADHTAAPADNDDVLEFEPLYAARRKVYPQSVKGTYRNIKWALLIVTLGIYYFLPFVRWNRGPGAPDQAVLVDFAHHRFYFFFIEIWPQEVYYLTGLLILAALALFLLNAIAGRVWCGYLCPQTVWTDLFQTVERWTEGDRRTHLRRDAGPWTVERFARLAIKHFLWIMIAWWTGGAWVLYFADAPTLVKELATGEAPFAAYTWIGILTFTTYALAGHMREQVCTYMCPWPRIQAALTDEHALNVTYRHDRGEPRGSFKKNAELRADGLPAGDCIECMQCVFVCPTGVDIRDGANLGCIQCGLCIDACDAVMFKVGRPARLIAYDTEQNIERRLCGQASTHKIVRPRTILYAGLIVVVAGIMLYALATRSPLELSVIHDRNPIFVRLADGAIRNGYTLRVLNKERVTRSLDLSVDLPTSATEVVGIRAEDGRVTLTVDPDSTREFRLLVTQHATGQQGSQPLTFTVTDHKESDRAVAHDYFRAPGAGR